MRGQGAFNTDLPLDVEYPPNLFDSVVRLPLTALGIQNFFLTVR